jgi:acetyl-CoA synthetase
VLMRSPGVTYEQLRADFRWPLPDRFNMGTACADEQPATALALVEVRRDGGVREHTFGQLAEQSNRLANGLAGIGIQPGDRVGIVLPQGVEAGVAHLALYKLGAIAVPLSQLFGPDALRYRLGDCDARAVITDGGALDRVAPVAAELGGVRVVVAEDDVARPHHRFDELTAASSPHHTAADTTPDSPGLLIYTSGTTGPPKGALHGHRVLLGHLPGYELMFDFFPQAGDRVWTPADWAWIGGLMDALMPAWYHGKPVVGAPRSGFDPEWALDVMVDHRVRVAFLPPTALKLMRQAGVAKRELGLRAVMSGGEPLGEQMLDWGREHLGVSINEIFGQTEANLIVGNSSSVWDVKPGSMGRPYPGHDVAVLGADGDALPAGEVGEVAVRAPDPVMFLEYWNRPDATKEKFHGDWLLTGDLARADDDGYLWFSARNDDIINSAGYRIGPAEIEECLMSHPAVAMAAAVGIPDEVRGQVVKAFIKLSPGHEASGQLEGDISQHVRSRLAAYEYPRAIEFIDELPLTTTGKIRRNELRRREEERTNTAK